MIFPGGEFFKRLVTAIIFGFCFIGAYLHSTTLFSLSMGTILLLILIFEWPKLAPIKNPLIFLIISLIYPVLPVFILISITVQYRENNLLLPLYPFLVAWTQDTFGYFVGKLTGHHKICPTISPGKSWEGLIGSILGVSILNIFIIQDLPEINLPDIIYTKTLLALILIVLFSIFLTVFAFLGGFLLSFLKRKQGLKDAGDVLPGHGGFLDRFDSVMPIAIILWGLLKVL
jgi:phosphatidate cytidylyltransferase